MRWWLLVVAVRAQFLADRNPERGADRNPERDADRNPDLDAHEDADRNPERDADRTPDLDAHEDADRGAERGADRTPDLDAHEDAERGADRTPDRTPDLDAHEDADGQPHDAALGSAYEFPDRGTLGRAVGVFGPDVLPDAATLDLGAVYFVQADVVRANLRAFARAVVETNFQTDDVQAVVRADAAADELADELSDPRTDTYSPSYVPTSCPTSTPKPSTTPVPEPTLKPTLGPTEFTGITFQPQPPNICLVGELCRIGFTVLPIPDNNDDNMPIVDAFIENDSESNDIVLLNSYTVAGRHVIIDYLVGPTVPTNSGYQLRVIDYLSGSSATSSDFTIATYEPTLAPQAATTTVTSGVQAPAPTSDTLYYAVTKAVGSGLVFGTGDTLELGENITLTVQYTGTSQSEDGDLVVQLCQAPVTYFESCPPERLADTIYDVDVPAEAGTSNSINYVVPTTVSPGTYYFVFVDLVNGDSTDGRRRRLLQASQLIYVSGTFLIVTYQPTMAPVVPSYAPTESSYSPSYRPSEVPSYVPTIGCTFEFVEVDSDSYFQIGVANALTFRICDLREFGLVDILVISASDDSVSDVAVDYLEVTSEYTTVYYTPSSSLVEEGAYYFRGVEYVLGYDVDSETFEMGFGDYSPSSLPTVHVSYNPSPNPTANTLFVDVTKPSGEELLFDSGDSVTRGDELTVQLQYSSSSSEDGTATIRFCRGGDTFETCEILGDEAVYFVDVSNAAASSSSIITTTASVLLGGDTRIIVTSTVSPFVTITGTFEVVELEPSYEPTTLPTSPVSLILNPPSVWFQGTTNTLTLLVTSSERTVDVLLYQNSVSDENLVDVVVSYATFSGEKDFSYAVTADPPPGSYVLRLVDYTLGTTDYDLEIVDTTNTPSLSPSFPTYSPTLTRTTFITSVTKESGEALVFGGSDFLVAGTTATVSVSTQESTLSVGICRENEISEDNGCDSPEFVVRAASSFPATFTVPEVDGAVVFFTTGDVSFTGSFYVYDYSPTSLPSYAPTTAGPTAFPTASTIKFLDLDEDYVIGSTTNEIKVEYVGKSPMSSRLDILLYASSASSLADEIVEYYEVAALDVDLTFSWTVDAGLTPGTYYFRAIDLQQGLDVTSDNFSLVLADETYDPTPSPSLPPSTTRVVLTFDYSDVLTVGQSLTMRLRYTGSSTQIATTTVRMCAPEDCGKKIDTVAYGEEVSSGATTTITYTIPESFAGESEVVFLVEDASGFEYTTSPFEVQYYAPTPTPTPKPTSSPTLKPTPTPSSLPSPYPSPAGISLVPKTFDSWYRDETKTFDVVLTGGGGGETNGVVDVGVFQNDDDLLVVLADAAEMTDGVLSFAFTPSTLSPGEDYVIKAYEYERGYAASSDPFEIVDRYGPTAVPTPEPTPEPSRAPTTSTIAVTVYENSEILDFGDGTNFLIVNDTFSVDVAYTGALARSSGLGTVRICEASDPDASGYNGFQADRPVETCDSVELLASSVPFSRSGTLVSARLSFTTADYVYFRVDVALDRDSDDVVADFTLEELDLYVLAYETPTVFVGDYEPTHLPTPLPSTPSPSSKPIAVPTYVPSSFPTDTPTLYPTTPIPSVSQTDSPTWHKWSSTSKDCDWVGDFLNDGVYTRCDARSADDIYAYEACLKTCLGYVVPTPAPSTL
ncbi:hypothetical protein CTAYLR_000536 [Chrysophaeum taylorii]|uniref:Uncharacterized protein n=1 Tax=Chrysophaeum taylorii TaxID=2483200 RepID=A0AAD7UGS2_9STRA|nr:hypothetical protein CTAYLR_000536 [Chrysophaeum taylorii]